MIDVLIRIKHQTTEDCLKTVLKQLLDREPVPEDAKRLTLVYTHERYMRGPIDWSEVLFDGVHIGRLETFNDLAGLRTIFTPLHTS